MIQSILNEKLITDWYTLVLQRLKGVEGPVLSKVEG